MPQLAPVTGVSARYYGSASSGTTTYYYWVQAVYPSGSSRLSNVVQVANLPGFLTSNNRINVSWNPAPGAIGYYVYGNTTGTVPTSGNILKLTADSQTTYSDIGTAASYGVVRYDGGMIGRARYDFSVDGGANGVLIPAMSDTIPANAIMIAATINSTTAVLPTGATISIGTSAGSTATSILAVTAGTTLIAGALVNGVTTFAAPRKMSASGQIQLTIASGPITAGVVEIFVIYVIATNP